MSFFGVITFFVQFSTLVKQVAALALASPYTHMRGGGGSVSPVSPTALHMRGGGGSVSSVSPTTLPTAHAQPGLE
jgi:hypothetical protein